MFGTEYFIWLAICAVSITALTVASVKLRFSFRTASIIMAAIALVCEISKIVLAMEFANGKDAAGGMVIRVRSLPLHLCSLLIFAYLYFPFAKNEKLKKRLLSLAVPVGLVGATLAILMATSGTDFADPDTYKAFIYHAGMVWFSLYLILTRQAELGVRAWGINLATLFSLSVVMIWVNGVLCDFKTNFFYVVKPPMEGLPLLNLNNGWFAYIGALMLCCVLGFTLVHLPSMICEYKRYRARRAEDGKHLSESEK